MENNSKLKKSQMVLAISCITVVIFQIAGYFSTGCVVGFANLPGVCGEGITYPLFILIVFELAYPILILKKLLVGSRQR